MKHLRYVATCICLYVGIIVLCGVLEPMTGAPAKAQGSSTLGDKVRPIADKDLFVSIEARLSIALPQSHDGFRRLSSDTLVGQATGYSYKWGLKEGVFEIAYLDGPKSFEDAGISAKLFLDLRNQFKGVVKSQKGAYIGDREFVFEGRPAIEVKIDLPSERMCERVFLASHRMHLLSLRESKDQVTFEEVAIRALDSFKILSDSELADAIAANVAKEEPSPLPQAPVAPRGGSDAIDNGFRGRVKTVLIEKESPNGFLGIEGRRPSIQDNYDIHGNLTRKTVYDYRGYPFEIVVYGYVDGFRVSTGNFIKFEYDNSPATSRKPTNGTTSESAPLYSSRMDYRYDDQKRLIERTTFSSSGNLSFKSVYKYSGNTVDETVTFSDGPARRHSISILDENGNLKELTETDSSLSPNGERHTFTYQLGSDGNWIKMVASKCASLDPTSDCMVSHIEYRTITYY